MLCRRRRRNQGVSDVRQFGPIARKLRDDGEPPDNEEMETRVKALEDAAVETRDRLARIETRLDTFATKEDLHRELHSLSWKFVTWTTGIGTALIAATYFIARNVH